MAKPNPFLESGFECSPFGPPNAKGVYAICVMKSGFNNVKDNIDNVVYIGSSNDIRKRILNPTHVYRRLLNILKNYWVYTYFLECDNHIEFERELIRKYKPQFNRTMYGA